MKTNLEYNGVYYDYNRSECTCNAYELGGYCRCTTIKDSWIERIDVEKIINRLFNDRSENEVEKYCFDRICRIKHIYDNNLYEIESCGGYYGEEIDGVYFENEEVVEELYLKTNYMKSDIEKIQFILELEYGYLLDYVAKSTHMSVVKCSVNDIVAPQKEYYYKLESDVVDSYKNYGLPCAVCIEADGKYKIIDGYHRIAANKCNQYIDIIVVG